MKINLVFCDWWNYANESIYSTDKGVELSMRDFHSGSTFVADIVLDADNEIDLKHALVDGYTPVFYVHISESE